MQIAVALNFQAQCYINLFILKYRKNKKSNNKTYLKDTLHTLNTLKTNGHSRC